MLQKGAILYNVLRLLQTVLLADRTK